MRLKEKKLYPLFSIEFMAETDGIVMLRKKHKKVSQDIYIPRIYLLALIGNFKGEIK